MSSPSLGQTLWFSLILPGFRKSNNEDDALETASVRSGLINYTETYAVITEQLNHLIFLAACRCMHQNELTSRIGLAPNPVLFGPPLAFPDIFGPSVPVHKLCKYKNTIAMCGCAIVMCLGAFDV